MDQLRARKRGYRKRIQAWIAEEGITGKESRGIYFPTPLLRWRQQDPRETRHWGKPLEALWDAAVEVIRIRHDAGSQVRLECRDALFYLRCCWIAHHEDGRRDLMRYCFSEAWIHVLHATQAELIQRAVEAHLADFRRERAGIQAHGLPSTWSGKIKAALQRNPKASNRELARDVGCSEATVRRYRKK